MPLQDNTRNPGNLTVNRPGQLLYPGQTGTYGANGFNYAVFPDNQAGFSALVDYVQRHVSSGWNTVSGFVFGYLGTSTPNQANPAPRNYLSAVEGASGVTGAITPNDYTAIARGIATAEGNGRVLASLNTTGPAAGTPQGPLASAQSALASAGAWLESASPFNFDPANIAAGAQCIADPSGPGCRQAIADTAGAGAIAGVFGAEKAAGSFLAGWTIPKIALTVLGVGIILAALVLLGMQNKTVQQVVRTATA